jgi:hypothetical protein
MKHTGVKKTTAYRFFLFDTFVNWGLGILFLFFYHPAEKLMSDGPLLPDFIWIIMGAAWLLFGIWQTYIVIANRFSRTVRLFGCITAWGPFLALTYALIFMNFDLFMEARIIIWVGNLYMCLLGALYLKSYLEPAGTN